MMGAVDVGTSWGASILRLGLGLAATHAGARPEQPIELYDFEACPFCRKVREAVSMLDLETVVYPCPKGGPRYRKEVKRRGSASRFPLMVDPNTGTEMFESSDIVTYLYERYGNRAAPLWLSTHITIPLGSLASGLRLARGGKYRPAKTAERPLELYGFEASPYVRLVRETLCELELAYVLRPVAKRSPTRAAFVERSGRMMVPWLADPNTGAEMFESADIRRYLLQTYAL